MRSWLKYIGRALVLLCLVHVAPPSVDLYTPDTPATTPRPADAAGAASMFSVAAAARCAPGAGPSTVAYTMFGL